jgi:hypothetical protein
VITVDDKEVLNNDFLRTYVSNFPLKEVYYLENNEYKPMSYISALGNEVVINFNDLTSAQFKSMINKLSEGESYAYYRHNGNHYDTTSLPLKTLDGKEKLTQNFCNYNDESSLKLNSEDNIKELFCIKYPVIPEETKTYDNFYSNIAITYNYSQLDNLYVQDKYWYLINKNQKINPLKRTYYLLC